MSVTVPVVETERLRLRAWRHDDIDGYARWMSDEDTVRYIGGKTLDRADAWRSMATMAGHWQLRGYGFWAVDEKASGALVGRVGLWNPEGWPGVEVGWLIGKEHQKRGYATEAARAALEHGFATLDVDRIVSVIHIDNVTSTRVAERLGEKRLFAQEIRGFPCVVWGITRAAFTSAS
jgi:RimJ/RimL family protein N-acetyltransferase